MKNEIILYSPDENAERVEVRIDTEKETVWLSQEQIVRLFQRDQSVISRHIRNVFNEGELEKKSNMQKMHIPNSDKPITLYNLDVIISVGYRVKSKQGTQFRIWANRILKDYLLKGYSVNQRMNKLENRFDKLTEKVNQIDLEKHNAQYPKIEIQKFTKAHDRFLIIDKTTVYHFGASLKDLGKKWFAFSKMEMEAVEMIANFGNGGGDE